MKEEKILKDDVEELLDNLYEINDKKHQEAESKRVEAEKNNDVMNENFWDGQTEAFAEMEKEIEDAIDKIRKL